MKRRGIGHGIASPISITLELLRMLPAAGRRPFQLPCLHLGMWGCAERGASRRCEFSLRRPLGRHAMGEPGSRSHSAMSSSGKTVSASSCLSSQCFDLLTKSCVKCSDLFKENTTEPASAVPASALEPTHPSIDLSSTLLIFGVPAAVVFILVLATLLGFLVCKLRKWRRKTKAEDKEAQGGEETPPYNTSCEQEHLCSRRANMEATSPLPTPGCQDPAVTEGDAILAQAPCQHLNGGLKMLSPPGKVGAKRRPCCQGDADGDIILLSTVYPHHEECNHGFPLPATELGATALVTTKTTQNCA